jgi:hypothetical protein
MGKLVLKIGAATGKDLNPRRYKRIRRACTHPNCAVDRCKYDDPAKSGKAD